MGSFIHLSGAVSAIVSEEYRPSYSDKLETTLSFCSLILVEIFSSMSRKRIDIAKGWGLGLT